MAITIYIRLNPLKEKEDRRTTIRNRNLVTRMKGDLKFDEYLRAHETGHFIQQRRLGFANFYDKIFGQYIREGFNNVYGTPGILEYGANIYSLKTIGYYYRNGMRYAY